MKPSRTEYDVGSTIHNQALSLTWARGTDGIGQWHLRKEAANQRDDTDLISGITDRNIMAMMDALRDKSTTGK